jgi:GNAT superfamily N-acetyltransferase
MFAAVYQARIHAQRLKAAPVRSIQASRGPGCISRSITVIASHGILAVGGLTVQSPPVDAGSEAMKGICQQMSVVIMPERPDSADASILITELEALLAPHYPTESRHGLSIEQLITQAVAFFLLRWNDVPAACGGIKLFGTEYGEIKRMYVRPQFRGQGFAKSILNHLADYARAQGVAILRLETGIYQPEAIGLYERVGFQGIPPFGAYKEDPLSRFYEKRIL